MGDFFTIPTDDKVYAAGVFDDSLREFGVNCKLTYESADEVCPNCIVNPRTGESTGRYKVGGPVPFELGEVCPVCDGRGRIQASGNFDIIIMTVDWNPKVWGDPTVRLPAGAVTTRGFLTDLPKVQRANYVILDIDNQFITSKFKLNSFYPLGAIVKHRYFGAIWERVEG